MPAHPVAGPPILEGVGDLAVTEDVHEKAAAGRQPAVDAFEQPPVVAHVLEHLDRHRPDRTAHRSQSRSCRRWYLVPQ